MDMLSDLTQAGTTIIMVTHSEAHASRANRVVQMLDGRFVDTTEM
jgi:putative ABC transport system ATP-binding protein